MAMQAMKEAMKADTMMLWQQDNEASPRANDSKSDMVSVTQESFPSPIHSPKDPNQQKNVEWLRGHHWKVGECVTKKESNMKATFQHPGPPLPEATGELDLRCAKLEEQLGASFTLGSYENA